VLVSYNEKLLKRYLTVSSSYATFATIKDIVRQIGSKLVEHSEIGEFTAQRSIIEELFPYIYLASRRMSLRSISRWLATENNVKLSDVAIARAMRNAETHWRNMAEAIEPAARIFAEAHDVESVEVLRDERIFEELEPKPPILSVPDGESPVEAYNKYTDSAKVLRNDWFCYPETVRAQCWRHLGILGLDKGEVKGRKHEERKRSKSRSAR